MVDKSKQFLYKIQTRNQLRKDLKEKKRLYAKLVNVPEALEEALILKAEIDTMEWELELKE